MLRHEFGSFDGRVWLNCAHQGPLPLRAVSAAQRASKQKVSPHLMSRPISALRPLGTPQNASASNGLHLLARGLPLGSTDEVLLTEGEFPATVFPWLPLRDRGVRVRLMRPEGESLRYFAQRVGQHNRTLVIRSESGT
jgi:hypothetical protein